MLLLTSVVFLLLGAFLVGYGFWIGRKTGFEDINVPPPPNPFTFSSTATKPKAKSAFKQVIGPLDEPDNTVGRVPEVDNG